MIRRVGLERVPKRTESGARTLQTPIECRAADPEVLGNPVGIATVQLTRSNEVTVRRRNAVRAISRTEVGGTDRHGEFHRACVDDATDDEQRATSHRPLELTHVPRPIVT